MKINKKRTATAIKVGCVGDSITAGVHSSGGIHPYPAQLQLLLDAAHGTPPPVSPAFTQPEDTDGVPRLSP